MGIQYTNLKNYQNSGKNPTYCSRSAINEMLKRQELVYDNYKLFSHNLSWMKEIRFAGIILVLKFHHKKTGGMVTISKCFVSFQQNDSV